MTWLTALVLPASCADGGTEPSRARVAIDRAKLALYHGRTDSVTATVYDAAGQVTTAPIVWQSLDRQVARVDSLGHIYGNTPGLTTITATAGTLTGTVDVTVRADSGKPQLGALALSPRTLDLTGGDAVLSMRLRVRDAESGIRSITIIARHPSGTNDVSLNRYCFPQLESGTITDGEWGCTLPMHYYSAPGRWRVVVTAYDYLPFMANGDSTSSEFTVVNPRTDDTPPTLDELTFTTQRTSEPGYGESRLMSVTAHDDESGMSTVEYYLDSDAAPGVYGCGAERATPHAFPWKPVRVVSGTCPVPLVASDGPVYRTISLVRLKDARGNVRVMTRDDPERAGVVTRIDIRK